MAYWGVKFIEPLCFLAYYFKRCDKNTIITTIGVFYNEDERMCAELVDFVNASTVKPEGWTKFLGTKSASIMRKGSDTMSK